MTKWVFSVPRIRLGTDIRTEPTPMPKAVEALVEFNFSIGFLDYRQLRLVVDHFPRNTAKGFECSLMEFEEHFGVHGRSNHARYFLRLWLRTIATKIYHGLESPFIRYLLIGQHRPSHRS